MEVKLSYIEFLLKLLNSQEKLDLDKYHEELIVNLYLTLLSLSNLEYTEDIHKVEKETIDDFLRKLNNLKVKIQLKRKENEINKLSNDLINQYYEDINILSIYIEDGYELEQIINSKEPRKLTNLIDSVTKYKMNKEDRKQEINDKRREIMNLLPSNNYYIENNRIYIQNQNNNTEITVKEFIEIFNYLLNPTNYKKIYNNQNSQQNHDAIIADAIKFLLIKEKKQSDINNLLIPILLTHIVSLNLNTINDIDTSEFHIENIKITELYSLASNNPSKDNGKTSKWRNISIPNTYLITRLKEIIKKGMYYYKDDTLILEHIEDQNSDFRVSIKIDKIKKLLTDIYTKEIKASVN